MKILHICGVFPPAFAEGGPVITTYQLSKALIAQGHEVFVLTTDICGGERMDVVYEDTEWEGVPVRYCHWKEGKIPYNSPELGVELRKRAADYDIVLMGSSWTGYGLIAGKVCRDVGLPYVMYAHGCYSPLRLEKSKWQKKIWWALAEKKLYQNAASVVALTQQEIADIRGMGVTSPIHHIPNGVVIDKLANPLSREQLNQKIPELAGKEYLLFMARFDPMKGIDQLIDAYAAQDTDALLVLAGPEQRGYQAEMKAYVASLGLQDKVIFPGMIDGEGYKSALIRHALLFALTSYGEGLSVATLEAMACGTPLFITDVCNLPEVAEHNAGFVMPLDPTIIANQLQEALNNRPLLQTMGENAYRLVAEKFTWESVATQTAEMCEGILSS